LNAGGIYLPIDRYEVVNIGNVGTYINSINDLLKIAGVPLPKVYGVKTREIDRIRTLSQWKCFTHFAKESLQKFIDSSNLDELSCYKDALDDEYSTALSDSSDRTLWKIIVENLEIFGEIPELKLIVQKQKQIELFSKELNNLDSIMTRLGLQFTNKVVPATINSIVAQWIGNAVQCIKTNYPMVTILERYNVSGYAEKIQEYIKIMDNLRPTVAVTEDVVI